jgi:hypothetical protein
MRFVERHQNGVPQLTRRFHQAGQKTRNHPSLSCQPKVVELYDRGNAQLKEFPREFLGGIFANRRIRAVAANKDIIEAFAQRKKFVFNVENKVLHPRMRGFEHAANGVGLARARRPLNNDAGT